MKKKLLLLIMVPVCSNVFCQTFKIMTYNIRHGEDMNGKVDIAQIAAVINKYKPDIVALQEVDSVTNRDGKVDQMKELGKLTGMNEVFERHFAYDGGAYGLGILSKFKIKRAIGYRLPYYEGDVNGNTRLMLMTEIALNKKKKVYFATVHLDYKKDSLRTMQAKDMISRFSKENKFPVIIAGDFNADPDEECISIIKSRFSPLSADTSYTYPSDKPKIKIDYIFLSSDLQWKMIEYKVLEEIVASDHRPVIGVVELGK